MFYTKFVVYISCFICSGFAAPIDRQPLQNRNNTDQTVTTVTPYYLIPHEQFEQSNVQKSVGNASVETSVNPLLKSNGSQFKEPSFIKKQDSSKRNESTASVEETDDRFDCGLCICMDGKLLSHDDDKCKLCGPCSTDKNDKDNNIVKSKKIISDVKSNNGNLVSCLNCSCPQDQFSECYSCCAKVNLLKEISDTKSENYNDNNSKFVSNTKVSTPTKNLIVPDVVHQVTVNVEQTSVVPDHNRVKYIFGDVIVMLIIPVLLLLTFIIYRKAKHLYQRRHYTRTNYLIDGMYCERNPLCLSDAIQLGDR